MALTLTAKDPVEVRQGIGSIKLEGPSSQFDGSVFTLPEGFRSARSFVLKGPTHQLDWVETEQQLVRTV